MNRHLRITGVLLALVLLGSCATLSEDQCIEGDWRAIGAADGRAGRAVDYIARHAEACAEYGIVPDRQRWLAGRTEGLVSYCTPRNAYEIGRTGQQVAPVCPAAAAARMAAPNLAGLRWYEIGREIDEIEDEIADVEKEIAALGKDDAALRARLLSIRSRLRNELFRLRMERLRYASWP